MNTKQVFGEQAAATSATIIVPAEQGEILEAFGDTVQVKISGQQTNGAFAVVLDTTPAGSGPPPHIHHREDELFIIVEGSYRFLVDGQWSNILGPGAVVYTPRGNRHTFQNVGETPSKHWIVATPSGFEQFFAQCAAVFAVPGPPDMAKILHISEEHQLEFVPPLADPPPEDAAV